MIDEHEAEQHEAGEPEVTGDPASGDAQPANELVTAEERDVAEDAVLGEAERALLRWAMRQPQRAPGEPLLRTGRPAPASEPAPPPGPLPPPVLRATPTPEPRPEQPPTRAPEPTPETLTPDPARGPAPAPPPAPAPAPSGVEWDATPWPRLHTSAEEAISALVAAGGPDPRDYASPRLDRRAKLVIAVALLLLFVVSVVAGFVGYRVTHRAAGDGSAAIGRPAGIHAAAPATRSV